MSQPARSELRLRIGELSRRTGVSVRLLRYYEDQHLLSPVRSSSGYREYDPGAVGTVQQIRNVIGAGLTTRVIGEVLPCIRDEDHTIVPTCPESRARIAAERDRIGASIKDLRRSQKLLDRIVHAAGDPEEGRP